MKDKTAAHNTSCVTLLYFLLNSCVNFFFLLINLHTALLLRALGWPGANGVALTANASFISPGTQ